MVSKRSLRYTFEYHLNCYLWIFEILHYNLLNPHPLDNNKSLKGVKCTSVTLQTETKYHQVFNQTNLLLFSSWVLTPGNLLHRCISSSWKCSTKISVRGWLLCGRATGRAQDLHRQDWTAQNEGVPRKWRQQCIQSERTISDLSRPRHQSHSTYDFEDIHFPFFHRLKSCPRTSIFPETLPCL